MIHCYDALARVYFFCGVDCCRKSEPAWNQCWNPGLDCMKSIVWRRHVSSWKNNLWGLKEKKQLLAFFECFFSTTLYEEGHFLRCVWTLPSLIITQVLNILLWLLVIVCLNHYLQWWITTHISAFNDLPPHITFNHHRLATTNHHEPLPLPTTNHHEPLLTISIFNGPPIFPTAARYWPPAQHAESGGGVAGSWRWEQRFTEPFGSMGFWAVNHGWTMGPTVHHGLTSLFTMDIDYIWLYHGPTISQSSRPCEEWPWPNLAFVAVMNSLTS